MGVDQSGGNVENHWPRTALSSAVATSHMWLLCSWSTTSIILWNLQVSYQKKNAKYLNFYINYILKCYYFECVRYVKYLLKLISSVTFKFIYLFWERERESEREHMSRGRGERQGERESESPAGSKLSMQSPAWGLKSWTVRSHDLSQNEVSRPTDWATQAPLICYFLK